MGKHRLGVRALGAVAVLGALLACKQSKESPSADKPVAEANGTQGSKCASDGDCKNGFLCESSVCLPADRVQQIRAATQAPAPATATATATAAHQKPDELTGVGGRSKVPTTAEWNGVGEITVRHSGPLGCETKMVREWLRVSCRGNQVTGVQVLSTTGMGKGEVFTFSRSGVASAVLPVRSGYTARIRYTWANWGSRTLSMQFPNGAPRPSIEFDQPPPK